MSEEYWKLTEKQSVRYPGSYLCTCLACDEVFQSEKGNMQCDECRAEAETAGRQALQERNDG